MLGVRLCSREADRVQSVPVGPMAASPEDPMLQKLLASAVPAWCGTKELRGMGSCSHTHTGQ